MDADGTCYALGRELSRDDIEHLKHDVERFKPSMLYKLMTDSARMAIYRKSVMSGQASESSRIGLFIIEEFEAVISTLSRIP